MATILARMNVGLVSQSNVLSLLPVGFVGGAVSGAAGILGQLVGGSTGSQVPESFQDNGILLAAPKKKVSHQKRRQRLLAPGKKHVQMKHHLNKCPSCGHYKRANTICMHCFENIRYLWKSYTIDQPQEPVQEQKLTELDKRVLYPGKMDTAYAEKLKDRDSYLERRMRTLPKDK
ncbi:Large ribosomal subunit protein bL32m [Nakaseomyces bracarensis]|uniref:Large ribosomal subunit protein bL32m n=1 Tax=Nakaseomyces bracarensis TaxID=273131 RepID=A0ABR4P0V7_9SACH